MTTMMEEIQESTVVEDTDEDDDTDHIACLCSPKVSLCGAFLSRPPSGDTWDGESDDVCEDCAEVAFDPCPRCGE